MSRGTKAQQKDAVGRLHTGDVLAILEAACDLRHGTTVLQLQRIVGQPLETVEAMVRELVKLEWLTQGPGDGAVTPGPRLHDCTSHLWSTRQWRPGNADKRPSDSGQ
jgi:DNA-binding IclR family transcriptional regulator